MALTKKPLKNLFKMAALSGADTTVQFFIRKGEDVESMDEKGRTPLILAASKGQKETCLILLAAGADPRAQDNAGNTALSMALDANC